MPQNKTTTPASLTQKSSRFTRDTIKQYAYMKTYGASPRRLRGKYAVTCIDETHVVVTRDDYNACDSDVYNIYGEIAQQLTQDIDLSGTPVNVRVGYVDTTAACGHCPRSMTCLKGRPPVIICPKCRRTNHGNSLLGPLYRKYADYCLVEDRGNMLAERHSYVPTTCPLWINQKKMVAKQPCPICLHKRKTFAIYTLEPQEDGKFQEVLWRRFHKRKRRRSTNPTFRDFIRSKHTHKKGKHETSYQQALQRPSKRAGKRTLHQW